MPDLTLHKYQGDDSLNFDAGIIGGGLAGLSLSILLAKAGYKIVLLEKEKYPFHRVCGEYISLESRRFIESLGFSLNEHGLPLVKKLIVSAPNGIFVSASLDPGGFGVSRFFLDNELKKIAADLGVHVLEETKASDAIFTNGSFTITHNKGTVNAPVVCGTFGKRSNLDVKWKRDFIQQKPGKLNNYIGVKYHITLPQPPGTIALHNFSDGYCGISRVEGNRYCLCYLTTAQNLKMSNNSIKEMEQNILCKNPFLEQIFSCAAFIFNEPVTISQVSFEKKAQVENHILMTGDAAGMITPLCGNGMSMAFHSSKIAFECIDPFLQKRISRDEMENNYSQQWKKNFAKRLRTGRMIQRLFGKEFITNRFVAAMKYLPFVVKKMIAATHGEEF